MATKSILKNIHIKSQKSSKALIRALENAKGKGYKPVEYSRSVSEASREDIRKIFGDKNEGL